MQRKLDALEDADRRLLSAASVQGMDFDTALVAGALQIGEEDLEDRLERLERDHALVRFVRELEPPNRALTLHYRFAHHMYQNAASTSLRADAQAALSRAIAERLVAALRRQPATAGRTSRCCSRSRAMTCARRNTGTSAAQAAARLYAHDETARLAQRGLALLAAEPDTHGAGRRGAARCS